MFIIKTTRQQTLPGDTRLIFLGTYVPEETANCSLIVL